MSMDSQCLHKGCLVLEYTMCYQDSHIIDSNSINETFGYITSHGYRDDGTGTYDNDQDCSVTIHAPINQVMVYHDMVFCTIMCVADV